MSSLLLLTLLSAPSQTLDDFYQADKVQSIHLTITDADQRRMMEALPERIYVPASFRWRDVSLEKVAVRFKGNSSSQPRSPFKRGFLIKFDEYEKEQRFLGMRRASLDNGIQFGSLFSEPIVTEILRDLGVKSHRCNYARLYVNGKYRGVHPNVERIDETFVARYLSDPKGALYKNDTGGPGGNFQLVSDNPVTYQKAFEPKNKTAEKETARLVEWIKMLNQANPRDVPKFLESTLELDDFLKVTAVMLFSGAFDQLTGWNPHNFYLHHNREQNRWRYLPWDLDVGFCEIAFGRIHVLEDWNAAWPVPMNSSPNPLLERIVTDPNLLKRYRDTAQSILDKYFEPTRLCKIVDAKYALIKQDLATDAFPQRRITNPRDKDYDEIVASIKQFVRKRYATASSN